MAIAPGWRVADLEVMPQPLDDTRYEIIDGELYVTTQPSYQHQLVSANVTVELVVWSRQTNAGQTVPAPGVIFAEYEAVAPDVVWTSRARLPLVLGEDGKLHAAPELIVEVLSPGASNEKRDRETKLGLYSRRGVREYWLIDWRQRAVDVFRRRDAALQHLVTLYAEDMLESPLLLGFTCPVARLFTGLP